MKRGALHHTKMIDLCERLGVPRYVAVGILESLWHLTAREAPRGDIGRMTDERIASGIDYPRKKIGELLRALIDSGWIDECPENRLVIHDWHEHADEAVKKALIRAETPFVVARRDKSRHVSTSLDVSAVGSLPVPEPSQCLAKPEPCAADAAGVCVGFDAFWKAWPKSLRKGARPQCLAKWRSLDLEPMADRIVAAVQHFARSPEWTKDGGQFIPAPLVWLNQRRWEAVDSVKASGTPTDPESRKRSDEFVAAWKRMAPAEREALAGSVRLAVSRIDEAVRWQTPPAAALKAWQELETSTTPGAPA